MTDEDVLGHGTDDNDNEDDAIPRSDASNADGGFANNEQLDFSPRRWIAVRGGSGCLKAKRPVQRVGFVAIARYYKINDFHSSYGT